MPRLAPFHPRSWTLDPLMRELDLAARLLEARGGESLETTVRAWLAAHETLSNADRQALARRLPMVVASLLPVPDQAEGGVHDARVARQLGVELEGMSPEDQEFEVARRAARLCAAAAHAVAYHRRAGRWAHGPPDELAARAVRGATTRLVPGHQGRFPVTRDVHVPSLQGVDHA